MLYLYLCKQSVLNIGDGAYIDLSFNSVDTETTALSDCQFSVNVIVKPSIYKERESKRERVCVCVCERERERELELIKLVLID